jgi:hypothetical protein
MSFCSEVSPSLLIVFCFFISFLGESVSLPIVLSLSFSGFLSVRLNLLALAGYLLTFLTCFLLLDFDFIAYVDSMLGVLHVGLSNVAICGLDIATCFSSNVQFLFLTLLIIELILNPGLLAWLFRTFFSPKLLFLLRLVFLSFCMVFLPLLGDFELVVFSLISFLGDLILFSIELLA